MFKINYLKLTLSLLICQAVGVIGSFFTVVSINTWYFELNKPSFNPPNWIFSPVWITLFVMMGLSLYLIWNKKIVSKIAISLFGIQLLLNLLWSILFFGLKSPLFAMIEIVFLWITILITTIYFYKISKNAAYLLIPYLLWVSFAAILNFFLYFLNI